MSWFESVPYRQHQSKSGQKHNTQHIDKQDNGTKPNQDTTSSCFVGVTRPSIEMRPLPVSLYIELTLPVCLIREVTTLPVCLTTELTMLPLYLTPEQRGRYPCISPERTTLCRRAQGTSSPGTLLVIFSTDHLRALTVPGATHRKTWSTSTDMRYETKHRKFTDQFNALQVVVPVGLGDPEWAPNILP